MHAYVFYAAGRLTQWPSLRLALRAPKLARNAVLISIIRLCSKSTLTHCALGYGNSVLDPCFTGDRMLPLEQFIERYPGLIGLHKVPLARWPVTNPDPRPKPIAPSVLRWATAGRTPAPRDCVSVVVAGLRSGGVEVPDRLTTPAQLFAALSIHPFIRIDA